MDIHSDISASSIYAKHIFQAVQKKKQKEHKYPDYQLLYLFMTFFLLNFAKCIICNVAFYDPTHLN